MDDPDPLVAELATLTTIQLYRFRATRFADLDVAHEAVQYLAKLNHPRVIPVLAEVAEQRRVGYTREGDESVERHNDRSRMVALLRLVKWHTPEAKKTIREARLRSERPHRKGSRAGSRALSRRMDWQNPAKRGPMTPFLGENAPRCGFYP